MELWDKAKDDLLSKCGRQHFSRDIELTKKENKAGKILAKLRTKMMDQDDMVMIGGYYDKLPTLLSSDLYNLLDVMPKPVVHHLHLTAAAPISFLVYKL
jgi:sugar (pentulose or hexulose) kinase